MREVYPRMETRGLNGMRAVGLTIQTQCTGSFVADLPTIKELEKALSEAGSAHHEYEMVTLSGIRDQLWLGFYSAYVLGKLGNFTRPSVLSKLLESSPDSDNWSKLAA